MDLDNVEPALSADPLRFRRDDEPWLDWATELYRHTLAELALSDAEWAAHFGKPHPGPGYAKKLLGQKLHLERGIRAARGKSIQRSPERRALLQSIFITALEGGIGYWCNIIRYRWSKAGAGEGLVDDIDNFRAEIQEDATGKRFTIDAEVIAKGLNALADGSATFGGQPLNTDGHLFKLARALNGPEGNDVDFDAGDADSIVQAGLFGDVVYG